MHRVPTDGSSLLFRCQQCLVEIAKPMPRDRQRRPVTARNRRCGREAHLNRAWRAIRDARP